MTKLSARAFRIVSFQLIVAISFRIAQCDFSVAECERFDVSECKGLGYDYAVLPNPRAAKLSDATTALSQVFAIVQTQCSSLALDFFCSSFLPECTDNDEVIYPCRSTCEEVRSKCIHVMTKYGVSWPVELACEDFPETNCRGGRITGKEDLGATTCESFESVLLCRDIGYNLTHFPHSRAETQEEAGLTVHQFYPLVKINCSAYLTKFLCSAYVPECTETQEAIHPCRSLCDAAKSGCLKIMRKFGFAWPDELDCSQFPAADCNGIEEDEEEEVLSCQPLEVSICKDIGYNFTYLPSPLAQTQNRAASILHTFTPLLQYQCSPHLKEFLCSAYLPECNENQRQVLPCRSLCEATKADCLNILISFGFHWPDGLDCNQFPTANCRNIAREDAEEECEALQPQACLYFGYNTTRPSKLPDEVRSDLIESMGLVAKFVSANCREYLERFLCSAYFPPCEDGFPVPCRQSCLEVQNRCNWRVISKLLPVEVDCNNFPNEICDKRNGNIMSASDKDVWVSRRLAKMARSDFETITDALARMKRYVNRLVANGNNRSTYKATLLKGIQYSIAGVRQQIRTISMFLRVFEENSPTT